MQCGKNEIEQKVALDSMERSKEKFAQLEEAERCAYLHFHSGAVMFHPSCN